MRQIGFWRGFGPLGSLVVLGVWLVPIGLALAQEENWQEWADSPSHPKWGWFGNSPSAPVQSTPAPTPTEQESSPGATQQEYGATQQGYMDPTSAAHPNWDSLPTEQAWTAQNEMAESAESLEPAAQPGDISPSDIQDRGEELSETQNPEEEASVCLSENGEPELAEQQTDSSDFQGEVQSMEEYFQRYGTSYAGASLGSQTASEENSQANSELGEATDGDSENYDYENYHGNSDQSNTSTEQGNLDGGHRQELEQPSGPQTMETSQPQSSSAPSEEPLVEEEASPTEMEGAEESHWPEAQLQRDASEEWQTEANGQMEDTEANEDMEQETEEGYDVSEDEETWEASEELAPAEQAEEFQSSNEAAQEGDAAQGGESALQGMAETHQEENSPPEPGMTPSEEIPEQPGDSEENNEPSDSVPANEATSEVPAKAPQTEQETPSQPAEDSMLPETDSMSPETESANGTLLRQEPSPEGSSGWEYEPGYGRVEAQYTPPADSSQPSPSDGATNSQLETGISTEGFSEGQTTTVPNAQSEALPHDTQLAPPSEFLPQDRYEYPEQTWEDGKQAAGSEMSAEEPSAGNLQESPSATGPESRQEAGMEQSESTPAASSEDHAGQAGQTESFWADMPGPVSETSPLSTNSSLKESQGAQEGKYEWWLENPDHWVEETSQPTDHAQIRENLSDLPEASRNQETLDENAMGETESVDQEGGDPSEPNLTPKDEQNGTSGDQSQDGQEIPALPSEATEQSRSGQPTLLKGLGQGLLRLWEPWGKRISGILDISTPPDWLTGTFAPEEPQPPQDGAAARPPEAMAR